MRREGIDSANRRTQRPRRKCAACVGRRYRRGRPGGCFGRPRVDRSRQPRRRTGACPAKRCESLGQYRTCRGSRHSSVTEVATHSAGAVVGRGSNREDPRPVLRLTSLSAAMFASNQFICLVIRHALVYLHEDRWPTTPSSLTATPPMPPLQPLFNRLCIALPSLGTSCALYTSLEIKPNLAVNPALWSSIRDA